MQKPYRTRRSTAFAALIVLAVSQIPSPALADVFTSLREIDLPLALGAQEPSLFTMKDGRILMSWSEPVDGGFAVKTAIGDKIGWSQPQTVVSSGNLFVNWADFPSVAAFTDGTLAIHWLMQNGPSSYDYDVNIALSYDMGRTWGDTVVPHRDGISTQHGFATLLPIAQNRLMAVWLDGRAYDADTTNTKNSTIPNAMQLRATTFEPDGSLSDDTLLDARTCTCCQTSAAVTDSGVVLVVYRDRTVDEVRDISLVRQVDGIWSKPKIVHADNWEISGCPVNGPAIDTAGERAVVAWFTAADDIPAVKVVFSQDAGVKFGEAIRVDIGEAAGRVDVVQLDDGSAVVSWVEWLDAGEALYVCRAWPGKGCSEPQMITLNEAPGSINFPRMVLTDQGVYIAWSQPLQGRSDNPDLDVTIRMVLGTL